MGQIICKVHDFSRQKTQYIFDSKPDTIQKHRLFFPRTNFPAKRLVFFFSSFLETFKSAIFFLCQKASLFFLIFPSVLNAEKDSRQFLDERPSYKTTALIEMPDLCYPVNTSQRYSRYFIQTFLCFARHVFSFGSCHRLRT